MAAKNFSTEPRDAKRFREDFDRFYTRFAGAYNLLVKVIPIWKRWLNHALAHIHGECVLEVSFGTGYLLTRYANHFSTFGIDYNKKMVTMADEKLKQLQVPAKLQVAEVEALPYANASFDTLINTMSFTGYPDAHKALSEMSRVLKPGGCLILIDVNYPADNNWIGTLLTNVWKAGGDIIRDMDSLFSAFDFQYNNTEIGGRGSIHLYVATKPLGSLLC